MTYSGVLSAIPVPRTLADSLMVSQIISANLICDILAITTIIAHSLGRIGCFNAGCCYGSETDNFFGVVFPTSSWIKDLLPGLPRHHFSVAANDSA